MHAPEYTRGYLPAHTHGSGPAAGWPSESTAVLRGLEAVDLDELALLAQHDHLVERQCELEYESVMMGAQRFREALGQGQSNTKAGAASVKNALPLLADAIDQFTKTAAERAGRRHRALPYLLHILPEQAAYLTLRHVMDGATEGRALTALAITLGTAVEDHINLVSLKGSAPGLYRKVMEQVKQATSARHRDGVLRHVVDKYAADKLEWGKDDKILLGTKLIELMAESTGMVEVRVVTKKKVRSAKVFLTPEAAEFFDAANEREARWHPVHLPMVVRPRDWSTTTDGGYLTDAMGRATLVQSHLPGAIEEIKAAEMPSVYSAVNAVQRTPWRINRRLLSVMREARGLGERFTSLFVEADLPLPPRPTSVPLDVPTSKLTAEQKEDLVAWKREAADVYEFNARQKSKRMAVAQKFFVADRMEEYERIYFPHYLDFRGRIYPFASYLNPQSDDVGRSMLEFAEGKALGERGLFWLKVHVANLFGVDKVSFKERVEWVEKNLEALLDSSVRPLDGCMKWTEADSPWCALAACMELAGACVAGPEFVSHLPIAMDGSCSGLQHYSAMLRDPVGGAAVNLVPQEKPGDIYTQVAKRAQAMIDASHDVNATPWKGGKVVRKIAKQPTMTLCYSATVFGMQGQIQKAIRELGGEEYIGGADVRASSIYMAGVIWEAIGDTVVAARDAMAFLKELSKVASECGLPIHWTAPSGFPVIQAYNEAVGKFVKVHYQGKPMQLTYQVEQAKLDKKRQASGVAPNFVHSLDSAHLMATVNLGMENGLTSWACIHDSFGVHATDVDVLHACIRDAFIEQYSGDVLANLREQIIDQIKEHFPEKLADIPPVPSKGTLDLEAVRDSAYFFA